MKFTCSLTGFNVRLRNVVSASLRISPPPAYIVYRAASPDSPPHLEGQVQSMGRGAQAVQDAWDGTQPSEDLWLLLMSEVGAWTRCIVHETAEGAEGECYL